jgi:hypothetical protein
MYRVALRAALYKAVADVDPPGPTSRLLQQGLHGLLLLVEPYRGEWSAGGRHRPPIMGALQCDSNVPRSPLLAGPAGSVEAHPSSVVAQIGAQSQRYTALDARAASPFHMRAGTVSGPAQHRYRINGFWRRATKVGGGANEARSPEAGAASQWVPKGEPGRRRAAVWYR